MRYFALGFAVFLLAAAFFYAPAASNELGGLIPVETLVVSRAGTSVCVRGGAVRGTGADWAAALDDLHATAPGTVFLETAERVIVAEDAAGVLPDLLADTRLRPSAQLYFLRGGDSAALEEFAAAHESGATVEKAAEIPRIVEEEGRYRLDGQTDGRAA